jgi:hypothetical protein
MFSCRQNTKRPSDLSNAGNLSMKFCLTQSPSKSFWRHTQWGLFILLVNWAMHGTSLAQTYPDKTIKFVVSFTAGGTTDILAREVAN